MHGFSLYNCNFFDDLYQKYNIECVYDIDALIVMYKS